VEFGWSGQNIQGAKAMNLAALAVFAIALTSGVVARGQGIDYAKIEILTERVAPNLYVLSGSAGADPGHQDAAGGRIGVLAGPDGIFMVDAQYAQITGKVVASVRKISSEPIRYLVNTHVHPDHTAGNANIVKLGAILFAREDLREEMLRQSGDPARLPVVTYGMGDPVKLHMNGEVVELIPIRAAHTGGDTMIRFENADAIMIGDFYRNYGYPFIDTNNGGTLKGALEALDELMKIAGPNTKLIPGHGTFINRADLVPYRDMILGVRDKVQEMIHQGKSEQEVVAAHVTAAWDAKVPGGLLPAGNGTSADRFVRMVYAQLKSGQ
jgi:glyoxylase-like metal-dependent hydrolase (beta-lactamase superfamily II)